MAMPTAQQALQRWQQGTQTALPRYTQGVANSADWAGNFAAAEPQMIANLTQALNSGHVTRRVQAVGTAGWRTKTQAKAQNWVAGVSSAQAAQNYQTGYGILTGYITTAQSAIASTPRGTLQQNISRMTQFVTSVHDQAQARKQTM